MNRLHDCFAGKPAEVHNFKALTIKKCYSLAYIFFVIRSYASRPGYVGVLVVKYEREKMRLGVALPKSVQKSKSTIFDKTNKMGHQFFS